MKRNVEQHPLPPFLPPQAEVLMLGSFPPPRKRWSMPFYYPNLNNDMWRIFGLLCFGNKAHFLTTDQKRFDQERIMQWLTEQRIAIYDAASAVCRLKENASDKYLEVVEATDIGQLLEQLPHCHILVTTGQKATDVVCQQMDIAAPAIGQCTSFEWAGRQMLFYRMPSSSRAYPLALEKKAAYYQTLVNSLHHLATPHIHHTSPMKPLFLHYPACGTCRKASQWLKAQGIEVEERLIVEQRPTFEELKTWVDLSGLPLKKFFNTSGLVYKEMNLKEQIPIMSEAEQLALLASNGKLVKRPILVTETAVYVGFKAEDWETLTK